MRIGIYVYAVGSVAAGIADLVWREFEPAHQPIQAWGEHIPGVTIFAYIVAFGLIAGGMALLWRRTTEFGGALLAVVYGIFVLFPLPRLYTAPHFLGYHPAVYIGVLVSVCQQVILFIAAVMVWKSAKGPMSRRLAKSASIVFGLCSVDFGVAHLVAVQMVVPMIPKWMPLGATFWVVLTGIAFVLAGLAMISGVMDILAAKLLGLMLLIFSVFALAPVIFSSPHNHISWGANAYNLTAVGAAWIVAECLANQRRRLSC
jgi:uncharacterized membrane protein